MAKRHARVKLSRAQKLERELNRWLAKKDGAIAMLCKAMVKLKELERSRLRMQRTAQLPVTNERDAIIKAGIDALARGDDLDHPDVVAARAAVVAHPRVEAKEAAVADALVEDTPVPPRPKRKRKANGELPPIEAVASAMADEGAARVSHAARMKSMGFRPTSKRASKPTG